MMISNQIKTVATEGKTLLSPRHSRNIFSELHPSRKLELVVASNMEEKYVKKGNLLLHKPRYLFQKLNCGKLNFPPIPTHSILMVKLICYL